MRLHHPVGPGDQLDRDFTPPFVGRGRDLFDPLHVPDRFLHRPQDALLHLGIGGRVLRVRLPGASGEESRPAGDQPEEEKGEKGSLQLSWEGSSWSVRVFRNSIKAGMPGDRVGTRGEKIERTEAELSDPMCGFIPLKGAPHRFPIPNAELGGFAGLEMDINGRDGYVPLLARPLSVNRQCTKTAFGL